MMWTITVVITFLSTAIGVNIPEDLFEGPMVMVDEQRVPLRYDTQDDCISAAEEFMPGILRAEVHVHGTDGLTVNYRCTLEQRDL